jgi:hypothetical protein
VATNGKRRPPRPRIELLTPAASADEAAAIVAAVERFIADTAPAPMARGGSESRWLRAALRDGVTAKELPLSSWGDPDPWGLAGRTTSR